MHFSHNVLSFTPDNDTNASDSLKLFANTLLSTLFNNNEMNEAKAKGFTYEPIPTIHHLTRLCFTNINSTLHSITYMLYNFIFDLQFSVCFATTLYTTRAIYKTSKFPLHTEISHQE